MGNPAGIVGVAARPPPRSGDPGDSRLPHLPDPRMDRGPHPRTRRAGPRRTHPPPARRLREAGRTREHLDGSGLHRHERRMEGAGPRRIFGTVGLRRTLAPARRRLVHVGDPARRHRRPLVLVPPDGAPRPPGLGDPPGAPLERVLQLRDRAAPEVEQQRRDHHVAAAPPDRHPTVDGFRRLLRQPRLPVLRAHRAGRHAPPPDRIRVQHALAPSGAPRLRSRLPRPQLRGHPHHLGPDVRHLQGRGPPAHLRAHQARRHVQHLGPADARVPGDRPRLAYGRDVPRQARLRLRPARLGAETDPRGETENVSSART